jgi:poly-gamma-glutamate synthesis protein (capsule biosynthesis protein)
MSQKNNILSIYAVGDIMLGDHPHFMGIGIGSRLRKGKLIDPFEHVKPILRKSDIVLGNLETVLSEKTNRFGLNRMDMRGEPSWAKLLSEAGFNVISVANNHAMQHGIDAWYESADNLRNVGISVLGTKKEPIIILELKGIRIGILGFSLRPPQYGHLSPPYCLSSAEEVQEMVNQAKKTTDIVILSLHWGDEYSSRPSLEQIQIGESLIQSGASLIIGHHPHVLQGIEQKGNGIIAYSLGNFVSDMVARRSRETAILSLYLSKKGNEEFKLIPVRIGKDSCPHLLEAEEDESWKALIEQYNASLSLSKKAEIQPEYQKEIKRSIKEFRHEFLKWLIHNWQRYPISTLFWIISGFIMRKVFSPINCLRYSRRNRN